MPANLENSAVATGLEKSVFIPIPKKSNTKESSNYHTIALLLHASKVMLKILQARLQQYMNWELPDVQTGFRKGRETRDQITNIRCIIEKARELQKNIYSASLTMLKPLTVWITTNWTILRWEYQTTLPLSWDTCMQVKKQQLESDVEIKRCLFLGRKALTNLDSILKSRDITFRTKVHVVKAMVFPVPM